MCANPNQGRDCLRSHNATRAVFGRPPVAGHCSHCGEEPCHTQQACEIPLAELRPIQRRLFTRRRFTASRAFLVGALFAIPGVALFIVEGVRYFITLH